MSVTQVEPNEWMACCSVCRLSGPAVVGSIADAAARWNKRPPRDTDVPVSVVACPFCGADAGELRDFGDAREPNLSIV